MFSNQSGARLVCSGFSESDMNGLGNSILSLRCIHVSSHVQSGKFPETVKILLLLDFVFFEGLDLIDQLRLRTGRIELNVVSEKIRRGKRLAGNVCLTSRERETEQSPKQKNPFRPCLMEIEFHP